MGKRKEKINRPSSAFSARLRHSPAPVSQLLWTRKERDCVQSKLTSSHPRPSWSSPRFLCCVGASSSPWRVWPPTAHLPALCSRRWRGPECGSAVSGGLGPSRARQPTPPRAREASCCPLRGEMWSMKNAHEELYMWVSIYCVGPLTHKFWKYILPTFLKRNV